MFGRTENVVKSVISAARLALVLAVLAVGSVGCGSEPSFVTEQGFVVYSHGIPVDKQQLEFVIDAATAGVVAARPQQYDRWAIERSYEAGQFEIHLTDAPIACPQYGVGATCRGFYSDGFRITYVHAECVGRTSLAHEVLHLLRHKFERDSDKNHRDRGFFYGTGSIETHVKDAAARSFCDD